MLAEIKAQYLYPYTDQISGPPGGDAQTNAWATAPTWLPILMERQRLGR